MSHFDDILWSGLWSEPCVSATTVKYDDDNDSDRLIL